LLFVWLPVPESIRDERIAGHDVVRRAASHARLPKLVNARPQRLLPTNTLETMSESFGPPCKPSNDAVRERIHRDEPLSKERLPMLMPTSLFAKTFWHDPRRAVALGSDVARAIDNKPAANAAVLIQLQLICKPGTFAC
jgi:hypothetical protein